MSFRAINPANLTTIATLEAFDSEQLQQALGETAAISPLWAATPIEQRSQLLSSVAAQLRERRDELARLITLEMGKLIKEARAEVEKCASVCDYYAEHGPGFLVDESIESDAGHSYVTYQPLGSILAIMPWNFPFWQVFRFAAPALLAGNTALLKHASNVPQCALAIEDLFQQAGLPRGCFRSLMIDASRVEGVIRDPRVAAVTLTGSEPAGRAVAAVAGSELKKCVLELGGSDPFIVLEDADLDLAVENAVTSRFLNSGQSCIAAKRFIVVEAIADRFVNRLKQALEALQPGDPLDEQTTLAPMARIDLRDELHRQVVDTLNKGAVAVSGCKPLIHAGAYYAPSIIDHISPAHRAYHEELFGPVVAVIRAADEEEALRIANDTEFGLGGSIWSQDQRRAEGLARQLESGCAFVNGMVKSDPRLPFGGIKHSGYGRELSLLGIREFVNAKTVWIR